MTTKMEGGSKSSGGNPLKEGMSRKNPPGVDASMTCKGPNVDSDATRSGVAPSPKTLGSRSA